MTTPVLTSAPLAATSGHDRPSGRMTLRTWLRLLACSNVIEGRIRTLLRERFETTLPRFDAFRTARRRGRQNRSMDWTMSTNCHAD